MRAKVFAVLLAGTALAVTSAAARDDDDDDGRFPSNPTFTTRAITPFAIEGLTGDAAGNLYTTGRQPAAPKGCPIWRIAADGSRVTVAFVPNPTACNPSGITFDRSGNLYVADGAGAGTVWKVTPDATGCGSDDSTVGNCPSIPVASAFATGVQGTNGIAFDRDGNLWTGDGTTGNGRVWRIRPAGGDCATNNLTCEEVFRIQPMANVLDTTKSGGVANVGRDNRSLLPGTISSTRAATNNLGSQPLVANGVAFTPHGDLYVADTARGAVWKVEFDRHGNVKSPMGCDSTFTANTLCLDAVLVAHPYLEGTDGIALDRAGNIWNAANERNAIVVVTRHGRGVVEFFRNPVNPDTTLRNAAQKAEDNKHILEFPTSPFLLARTLCVAQSDGDRRDNSPRAAGEVNGGTGDKRGKISCLDQDLGIPGLPLPVH